MTATTFRPVEISRHEISDFGARHFLAILHALPVTASWNAAIAANAARTISATIWANATALRWFLWSAIDGLQPFVAPDGEQLLSNFRSDGGQRLDAQEGQNPL
jgi:hypothetical protein